MIRCTLYGSPVAMDTNVTMISDVCPAHPACALPWGCAVDVAVSGPARLQACGLLPPLFYGMFTLCNQVHPAVAVECLRPRHEALFNAAYDPRQNRQLLNFVPF